MAPQTPAEQEKTIDELKEKPGIQSLITQAYIEPNVYVEFSIREDFQAYYGVKPTIAASADKAVTRFKAGTGTATGGTSDTNKGNGVSYSYKGRKMAGKKIKVPTTGGDAPLVNSKTTKRKKWMSFRVPSMLSSAAIALWINTSMDANRRPSYFILESGTRVNIDPQMNDPAKLKPLKSVKGKSEA